DLAFLQLVESGTGERPIDAVTIAPDEIFKDRDAGRFIHGRPSTLGLALSRRSLRRFRLRLVPRQAREIHPSADRLVVISRALVVLDGSREPSHVFAHLDRQVAETKSGP